MRNADLKNFAQKQEFTVRDSPRITMALLAFVGQAFQPAIMALVQTSRLPGWQAGKPAHIQLPKMDLLFLDRSLVT